MSGVPNNPPAFPRPGFDNPAGMEDGMTLRDYYAGQALAGIMANPERWKQIVSDYRSGKKTYEQCSKANAVKVFSIADAMLAAREQPTPPRDLRETTEGEG